MHRLTENCKPTYQTISPIVLLYGFSNSCNPTWAVTSDAIMCTYYNINLNIMYVIFLFDYGNTCSRMQLWDLEMTVKEPLSERMQTIHLWIQMFKI